MFLKNIKIKKTRESDGPPGAYLRQDSGVETHCSSIFIFNPKNTFYFDPNCMTKQLIVSSFHINEFYRISFLIGWSVSLSSFRKEKEIYIVW